MLDWLLDSFEVFGPRGQNWMLAFAFVMLAYISGLVVARQMRTR